MTDILKSITWKEYLIGAAVITLVYYGVVLLLLSRNTLWRKMSQLSNGSSEPTDESHSGELMEELKEIIEDLEHSVLVPGNEATKEQLLSQLQSRVANFGGFSRPGYRYALNNFIMDKALKNCGVDLSEEELETAWNSLPR